MFDISGKIACVTGASSGIGAATAEALAEAGCDLVISARREDKIKEFAQYLSDKYEVKCYGGVLDVRDQKAVEKFFAELPEEFKNIEILVNNAGLAKDMTPLYDNKISDWEQMIDTNVKGLLYVTKAVLPVMIKRDKGHIVNIGSTAGRGTYPGGTVYCATKHAVNAITNGLRKDLLKTSLRVTTIDPGAVETEFSMVRFEGDKARSDKVYEGYEPLHAEDIADAVHYVVTRPPHVNVSDMIIYPTAQRDYHLVNRKS